MIRHLRALVEYRELLYFLTLREIKSRYKQTVLGVAWAVLQPLALMIVMTVVFSLFVPLPTDGVPYAIFSYCALLPWTFFAGVLGRSPASLLGNQSLVNKVYFPREVLVLATVASGLVDLAVGAVLLLGLFAYFHVPLSLFGLLALPILGIQLCLLCGLALIVSSLNVLYRDVSHLMPLIIQVWMFASPVLYPMSVVPERFRAVYEVNPMAGVLDAYRQVLLQGSPPDPRSLGVAALVAVVCLVGGLYYFKQVEFVLVDVM